MRWHRISIGVCGGKINLNIQKRSLIFTQPVLLQSFRDEFELEDSIAAPMTSMEPRRVLVKGAEENLVNNTRQTYYRSWVGKMLNLIRWSRLEIKNTRELTNSTFLTVCREGHIKAMLTLWQHQREDWNCNQIGHGMEKTVRHNEELANWKEANISLVVVRLIHPSFNTSYSETTARIYTYV